MDKTPRPDDPDDRPQPANGPLTQLVDQHLEPSSPQPLESELPPPPKAKPTGRDDYASGTSEHDDDGETS
jgi:hypothetical protein